MKKIIYYGSREIVNKPSLSKGKPNNDYGKGFYCTEDIELAKEWSVGFGIDGYVNKYSIDIDNLSILNLDDYCSLTWLAILIENREFTIKSPIAIEAKEYLLNNFSIDYKKYDVIYGYRADDSYFDFAKSFLNNVIPLEILENALRYGDLGKQFVLKSNKAFDAIKFIDVTSVDNVKYYYAKVLRDSDARKMYRDNKFKSTGKQLYMNNIIEKGLKCHDF